MSVAPVFCFESHAILNDLVKQLFVVPPGSAVLTTGRFVVVIVVVLGCGCLWWSCGGHHVLGRGGHFLWWFCGGLVVVIFALHLEREPPHAKTT